jgi:beta-1,4-mannosyltransferase
MTQRRPRVMQSFRAPRPTTNPYIAQLDRALADEPSIEHLRWSWKTALVGRVDAFHFHWPETLLEGDRGWKRVVRRTMMRALLAKTRVTRAAIVRTAHNVEIPGDVDPATRRLLERIEARTTHRIVLNDLTEVDGPTTVIPHGHYRDWFEKYPHADAVPSRVGYFGLIRRYKGVETLLDAYRAARTRDASLSMDIGGRPSTPELAEMVEAAAAEMPSISHTLRFLDDSELVRIGTSAQVVVLPYRFMHNSGSALAALSLDRPVLVPRNDVNTLLADEVGEGWVLPFDGELDADDLLDALARPRPEGRPDLSRREWKDAGHRHADAFRRAIADARARR